MNNIACSHCNLTFPKDSMIFEQVKNKDLHFCCKGCQGVYHLLDDSGLETFYDKLGDTTLTPANNISDDLEKFDLDGFKARYITMTDEGFSSVNLIIEGIHCSACVWLNEKVLHKLDGVLEASINYTNNKAKIVWDHNTVELSTIIETIRSIGYNAFPYDAKLQEDRAKKTQKDYYSRILVAVFGSMNIMWLAVAHYAGYFSGIEQSFKDILNWAEFVLATPVLFYSGWIFFRGAYYGYKNNIVNMDTLVASGALLAYIYSIYATISRDGEVYFDSVAMIITFVLTGKYLEILSKKSAVDTLDKITGSIPTEVTIVNNKVKSLVSVEQIKVGDTIEIKAGEKVVIDGEVIWGEASFDESSITGESEPIYKTNGSAIVSGSMCIDSVIQYKATTDAQNSMLTSIAKLLEESISKKPKIEQLANQISGYFSTTILVIALLTFVGWYLYSQSFEQSLIIGISVIVIACPCALGLATPMATLVGIGIGAKRSILFKEATFLETMAKSTVLAIDKTGTITHGKPEVVKESIDATNEELNAIYSLVSTSNHPVSQGVKEYLEKSFPNLSHVELSQVTTIEAKGLSANYNNLSLIGGNEELVNIEHDSDNSIFAVKLDEKLIATFELNDTIKSGAKETIESIKNMGIKVIMLTGDNAASANKVASKVGIDEVYSKLLPQDKSEIINKLHSEDEVVVMVGDGVNDTIALASSDIAIAMGSGADIAISVSDIVLLDNSLEKLDESFKLSKRTFKAVKENLGFSLLYNVVAVPLAVMGFVNPLVAAASMSLSSLVVVLNSLRIKSIKLLNP